MDSDFNQKLQAILSDPDSLQSILKIAQNFTAEGASGNAAPTTDSEAKEASKANKAAEAIESEKGKGENEADEQTPTEKQNASADRKDLGGSMLPALLSAVSSQTKETSASDERIRLLLSLRPFLAPPKRQKVDSLIKALSAAQILTQLKDTDIFKSFGL